MTPTPDFNDLTPPDELVQALARWNRTLSYTLAYRAGARYGWEQARQLWPEPITDRAPTEKDGDGGGYVQYVNKYQRWDYAHWQAVANAGRPWLHTPRWQPTLQEQAVSRLQTMLADPGQAWRSEVFDVLNLALSALEQAGEGKA